MPLPRMLVTAPPHTPRSNGLLSVAVAGTDLTGPGSLGGVEYESECGLDVQIVGAPCDLPAAGDLPELVLTTTDGSGTATITVGAPPGGSSFPVGPWRISWGDGATQTVSPLQGEYEHTYDAVGAVPSTLTYTVTVTHVPSGAAYTTDVVFDDPPEDASFPLVFGFAKSLGESGLTTVDGDPFVIVAALTCRPVGGDDLEARVERLMARSEQVGVERYFYGITVPALAATNGTFVAGGSHPVDTLAAVEWQWAIEYPDQQPTLHTSTGLATMLAAYGALHVRPDGSLRTALGSPVSVSPEVSSGDLYATGTVVVHRGVEVKVPPVPAMPRNNDYTVLAERLHSVTVNCGVVFSSAPGANTYRVPSGAGGGE